MSKANKENQSPILESIKNFRNIPSEIAELNRKFTALNPLEKILVLLGIVGCIAIANIYAGNEAKKQYFARVEYCESRGENCSVEAMKEYFDGWHHWFVTRPLD